MTTTDYTYRWSAPTTWSSSGSFMLRYEQGKGYWYEPLSHEEDPELQLPPLEEIL